MIERNGISNVSPLCTSQNTMRKIIRAYSFIHLWGICESLCNNQDWAADLIIKIRASKTKIWSEHQFGDFIKSKLFNITALSSFPSIINMKIEIRLFEFFYSGSITPFHNLLSFNIKVNFLRFYVFEHVRIPY